MTIVSKAGLAAELGITRGRVTQYLTRGMPVRKDGNLDRETALAWIKRNVDPTTSSKGFFAAASTRTKARGAPPIPEGLGVLEKIKNPAEAMTVLALLSALTQVGAKASLAAHGAGARRDVAERAGQLFTVMFVALIEEFVADHDILDPAELTFPHPRNFDAVVWSALGPPGEFARQAAE